MAKNSKELKKKEKEKNVYLCLISNTLPQLEPSSLQPSTVLHHRHLLQTTCYNHLLILHLLISRKENAIRNRLRTPSPFLAGGGVGVGWGGGGGGGW